MSLDDARVITNERGDGNGFRRREREIEEHSPIGQFAVADLSSRLAALCETLAGLRMPIFAKGDKVRLLHDARQSKHHSADAEPFAAFAFAFGVVVTDAQMLIKVALRVGAIGLSLARKHRAAVSSQADARLLPSDRRAVAENCDKVALMKSTSSILAKFIALLTTIATLQSTHAMNAVLSDDTTINRAIPRASNPTQPTLGVVATAQGVGRMAYAKFDLSNLALGPGVTVRKATLRVYCSSVKRPGSIQIVPVMSPWTENEITGVNAPDIAAATQPGTPVTLATKRHWVTFDVTEIVRGWVEQTTANYGVQAPRGTCFDGVSLWVCSFSSGAVVKLGPRNGNVLGTFAVGAQPESLCIDGAHIWITNQRANSVSRLNQNGELIGTCAVETAPAGIVFDGRSIWVTNSGSNTVTQLDCITGQLIDTSPVGNSPLGLCVDGTAVWIANKTSNNLLRR